MSTIEKYRMAWPVVMGNIAHCKYQFIQSERARILYPMAMSAVWKSTCNGISASNALDLPIYQYAVTYSYITRCL